METRLACKSQEREGKREGNEGGKHESTKLSLHSIGLDVNYLEGFHRALI